MKSNALWKMLFNPFTRIAGWQAFLPGLVVILALSIVGSYSGIVFDGVVDVHFSNADVLTSLQYMGFSMLALILVFWLVALLLSNGFRFIDLLGTLTLSKAPYLLLAIAGFFADAPDAQTIISNPGILLESTGFLIVTAITIPVTIWSVALMYHAFSISCDLKGSRATVAFIVALLFAETLSKIFIHYFV